jgi:hypothetical protein
MFAAQEAKGTCSVRAAAQHRLQPTPLRGLVSGRDLAL